MNASRRTGEVDTLHPRTWAWVFSVVGALLDKLAQWARRWRLDHRADGRRAPALTPLGPGGQRRERKLSGVHSTFTTPDGREGVLGAACAERR